MKIALIQLDANDELWYPEHIPDLLILIQRRRFGGISGIDALRQDRQKRYIDRSSP